MLVDVVKWLTWTGPFIEVASCNMSRAQSAPGQMRLCVHVDVAYPQLKSRYPVASISRCFAIPSVARSILQR